MSPPSRASHQYLWLDGVRGLAALAVVATHIHESSDALLPFRFENGWLAVDLFFGLSGFVLAHAYTQRFRDGLGVAGFLRIRLIRFYPLYLIGTLIGIFQAAVALGLLHRHENFPSAGALLGASSLAVLMLPSPGFSTQPLLYPFDSPAWSLFFEMLVNVGFAALWLPLRRRPLALCSVALLSLVALIALGLREGSDGVLAFGWSTDNVWGGIPRTLFSFTAGLLLYRLHEASGLRLPAGCGVLVLAAPLMLGIPLQTPASMSHQLLLIAVGFPLLIFLLGSARDAPAFAPLLGFLGRTSFALYALHYPVLLLIHGVTQHLGLEPQRYAPWSGLLLVAFVVILAALVDRMVDVPVRRWLNRRLIANPA